MELDLDAIEARRSAALAADHGQFYDAAVILAADVPALVAEVRRLREHATHDAEVEQALTADLDDARAAIAHARADVPDLVAEVRRLRESLDEGFAAIALAGAEIERASVEVDRAHRALLASNAERDDARAAIAHVRALHVAGEAYYEPNGGATLHRCEGCDDDHPCDTIRALDGDA